MDPERSIGRTIALYGPLLDDRRFDEWGGLFAEDAVWAIPGSTFAGRQEIVDGVSAMQPPTVGCVRHLSLSPIVDLDGRDHALAWTDFSVMARPGLDAAWEVAAVGRYCDELVEIGDRWVFRQRMTDLLSGAPPAGTFQARPRV